ncbi:MAG: glycoside hydrolase domain-containing protein [Bacteroidota bacterium]
MRKIVLLLIVVIVLLAYPCHSQERSILSPELYDVASWEHVDSLGNHRAVVRVSNNVDAVLVDIPWRMREIGPEEKNIVVVSATNGNQIKNVFVIENNRHHGKFVFQPVSGPGDYFVYYLTYKKTGSAYPQVNYYPYEDTADPDWVAENKLAKKKQNKKLKKAELIQLQSINKLNSFYPMEIMATPEEIESLVAENSDKEYIVFSEDRKYPIRSNLYIPYKWINNPVIGKFSGTADNGEYYTFQLAAYAYDSPVKNISVKFEDLINEKSGTKIPERSFTCFNTEGIDVMGNYFEKSIFVPAGELRPLWIGVEIPEGLKPGSYSGMLRLYADGMETVNVKIDLNVSGNILNVSGNIIESKGDDEIWRHSRLRWLNSTLGTDDKVVSPFIPLKVNKEERSIDCLGRTVYLAENGLPEQVISWFSEKLTGFTEDGNKLLNLPVRLVVDAADKSEWEVLNFDFKKITHGNVEWESLSKKNSYILDCKGSMDFDGNIDYQLTLMPTVAGEVNDIYLDISLKEEIGKYMMGLGEVGGYLTEDINWKWGVEKNQDGPWIGKENAGVQVRFRDINYERPLNTNFYHKKPLLMPPSWYNNGKGGINIQRSNKEIVIRSYSGQRAVDMGDVFHFYFNMAITPFKTIDTKKQWSHRFYHRHFDLDSIAYYGANTVNIHHATDINPYINYPFLTPELMKVYVDEAHSKGMKVKFYYTLRELSNSCHELFALRSLGTEIFSEGEGGGYSWLQEHLDQNYIAAWFSANKKDAAIINSGVSRWHNYYIEGLNWLVTNIGIDGIYIDDLAFDRITMKRMRKVLERGNPGTFLDLHSANQYNERDGFANSANLYLEHMPYIDRLWFGEYFDYDRSPDFWMVEVTGLPYGVMGEMLQDGGNPWRGMLYGMTGRLPWRGAKVIGPIWKLWDDFGIEKSDMIGYWVSDNPVKTNSEQTLATAYVRKGVKTLVSIATWHTGGEKVRLDIDWEAIELNKSEAELYAPYIENFQDENTWNPDDIIDVPEGKGYLIILQPIS